MSNIPAEQEVAQLFRAIDHAVKQFRLYGASHPRSVSMMKEALARAEAPLRERDKLSVEVFRESILFEKNEIFKIDKTEGNYIQEMYLDGVRALEFFPGITYEEIKILIAIMARDFNQYESKEDDSVTLIWKNDFRYIRCESVDVYQSDMNAFLRQMAILEEWDDAKNEEKDFLIEFVGALLGYTMKDPTLIRHQSFDSKLSTSPIPEWLRSIASDPSPDPLKEEMLQNSRNELLSETHSLLCEILENQIDSKSFERLVDLIFNNVRTNIKEGKISSANLWLVQIDEVKDWLKKRNPEFAQIMEAQFLNLSDPNFFSALGETYSSNIPETPAAWKELFSHLGAGCAEAVCRCLMWISQETFANDLCDFLCKSYSREVALYMAYLKPDNPKMAKFMMRVLSVGADPHKLADCVRPFLLHEDPDVRKELLRLRDKLPKSSVRPIIMRSLKDPEEDLRMVALRHIAQYQDTHFAETLRNEIVKIEFDQKSTNERKMFFTAWARLFGKEALALLSGVIDDTGRDFETRLASLQILAKLPYPEAKNLLLAISKKIIFDRAIAKAAKELLEKE